MANLPLVSTTLAKMMGKFATGGKFAAGVVDTGGNFAAWAGGKLIHEKNLVTLSL